MGKKLNSLRKEVAALSRDLKALKAAVASLAKGGKPAKKKAAKKKPAKKKAPAKPAAKKPALNRPAKPRKPLILVQQGLPDESSAAPATPPSDETVE